MFISTGNGVQILDEAIHILLSANSPEKGMH